jgi:hypothetical protein
VYSVIDRSGPSFGNLNKKIFTGFDPNSPVRLVSNILALYSLNYFIDFTGPTLLMKAPSDRVGIGFGQSVSPKERLAWNNSIPLRPTQTERDSATRREFSVFKNK